LPKDAKEKKKKHALTAGTDPLLRDLRDLNFAQVGKKLSKIARRLEEDYKVGVCWFFSLLLIGPFFVVVVGS